MGVRCVLILAVPMNLRSILPSLAAAACLAAGAAPPRPAMVSVDLSKVASELAEHHRLDESLMPLSILVPREVAAKVCGLPAGRPALTAVSCTASTSSKELGELVKGRMKADEPPPTASPPQPSTRRPAD